MPNRFKVYFDEDGKRCPKNVQALRRLPECGIFDRNALDFIPANRPPVGPPVPPKPGPFMPRQMSGLPRAFNGSNIPDIPEEPNPVFPTRPGMLIGGATGPGSQFNAARLPQDETTLVQGKGVRELNAPGDYQRISTVPTHVQSGPVTRQLGSLDARNTGNDDVFQSIDDAMRSVPHTTTFTNVNRPGEFAERTSADAVTQSMLDAMQETSYPEDVQVRVQPRQVRIRPSPIPDDRDTEFGPVLTQVDEDPSNVQLPTETVDELGVMPGETRIPTARPPPGQRPRPRTFKRPTRTTKTSPPLTPRARGKLPMSRRGYSSVPTSEGQELQDFRQRTPQSRELGLRNVEEDIGVSPSAGASSSAGPSQPAQDDTTSPGSVRAGRKRRMGTSDYYEVDQSDPDVPRMVARTGRGRIMSQLEQRGSRVKANIEFAANNAKRFRAGLTESLRAGTQGTMQDIRAFTTRQFGQGYEKVVSDSVGIRQAQAISGEISIGGGRPIPAGTTVNASASGDITVTRPITEDVTGLRDIPLDFSPFQEVEDQPTVIGRAPPKLSFSERINIARDSFTNISAADAGEMAGKTGAGLLFGMGVGALMGNSVNTGNKYVDSILVGGTSGVAGDVGARTTALIAQKAALKFGKTAATVGTDAAVNAGADAAVFGATRAATAILRGGAEGLGVGIVAAPLDLLLNNAFVNMGASHAAANVGSSALVGAGTTATIGAISLAAAPETLGLSLAVGAFATGVSALVGFFTGKAQDDAEAAAKKKQQDARNLVNNTATARRQLLASLPQYNYNFDKAVAGFKDKKSLGEDTDTWTAFSRSATQLFVPKPSNTPAPAPGGTDTKPPDADQQRLNNLFGKYIQHQLVSDVCAGVGTGCDALRAKDQGELTDDETKFLNDKTGSTWKTQADMQVEMSKQELNYTQKRIQLAQQGMVNAWNDAQKLPDQLDPYTTQTAYLDPTFQAKFQKAIKLDAQQRVINAYYSDQTRLEALPPNIQAAAGYDKDFKGVMDAFYSSMDSTASQLEVTLPQLIQLQSMSGEQQRSAYQGMQFDRIKTQRSVVKDAQQLSTEQDQVRAAGFYDIDQAFMQTDPTAISSWKPTDSQILQAHAAGLNLNQYVAYMHQLALGQAGDYSKLPTYTEAQLRSSGLLDYSHLQDELQVAGYRRDLYLYDPATRMFTLNPSVPNLPDQDQISSFISAYTPAYLVKARNDYKNMINGLNEQNQASVDQYNTNLRRQLTVYGAQYTDMVAAQNEYLISHSGPVTQLLHFDVDQMFNQYTIDYNQLETALPTKDQPIGGGVTAPGLPASTGTTGGDGDGGRELSEKEKMEKAAAERYGMDIAEYKHMKDLVQASLGPGTYADDLSDDQRDEFAAQAKGMTKNEYDGFMQNYTPPTAPSTTPSIPTKGTTPTTTPSTPTKGTSTQRPTAQGTEGRGPQLPPMATGQRPKGGK